MSQVKTHRTVVDKGAVGMVLLKYHPKPERRCAMTDITERVARLEGAYEHLATKADIAELKGTLRTLIVAATLGLAALNIILQLWPKSGG